MTASAPARPGRTLPGAEEGLALEAASVLRGLRQLPRQVSPRYFYDETGSRLFDEICRQPEYYPTRTEAAILGAHAADIARTCGPGVLLIEPGCGSAEKSGLLLSALRSPAGYVPVEICAEQLAGAVARLAAHNPRLPIRPVCADFTRPLALPALPPHRRRVVFFPGSTLGNFSGLEAVRLLASFRRLAGPDGLVLVGIDLVKPVDVLERAYDDAAGVTARFNLNLLRHLNARFGADFDPARFRHAAPWCPTQSRIEMQLWSLADQVVSFGGVPLEIRAGEKVITEWSHKYTPERFAALAAEAGLARRRSWTDPLHWFSLECLARS